eukprot:NODE_455_length_8260_cov_0.408406.p3 type:complete len:142 gc:universal NODE_455_length_8260_cov_0.408406:4807-4382(-)
MRDLEFLEKLIYLDMVFHIKGVALSLYRLIKDVLGTTDLVLSPATASMSLKAYINSCLQFNNGTQSTTKDLLDSSGLSYSFNNPQTSSSCTVEAEMICCIILSTIDLSAILNKLGNRKGMLLKCKQISMLFERYFVITGNN